MAEEPSLPEEEVLRPEAQFAAVWSPREPAPAEPPLLDVWLLEECPKCLSVVVRSPQEATPAGWFVVVQLHEELTPAGPSPVIVRFREEPTPARLLSAVVRLHDEPTPAGPSSLVVQFLEGPTSAGRSAWDSMELQLPEEPKPSEFPLLLRELEDRLWECLSQWESSWPLFLRRFWSSWPLSSSFLNLLAGAGDGSWSISHGTAILLDGT